MFLRKILFLFLILSVFACSKDEAVYKPTEKIDPFILYKEGLEAFETNDFFYASKKFSEAELNLLDVKFSSKAAILSGYCLYRINFYDESLDKINRFLKRYPADSNVPYAHYLSAIISFEQISDE